MRRMLWAGLLALPLVLSSAAPAAAQGCATGGCPSGFSGAGLFGWGGPHRGSPWHCGAICMRMFGALHQDGPLFNYGPYTGYYPFEPYGPWTSDLRYNNPAGCGRCGGFCGGRCGLLGGLFHRDRGCDGCGYAMTTWRNVFSRIHPFAGRGCHSKKSCGTAITACGAANGGCITER